MIHQILILSPSRANFSWDQLVYWIFKSIDYQSVIRRPVIMWIRSSILLVTDENRSTQFIKRQSLTGLKIGIPECR